MKFVFLLIGVIIVSGCTTGNAIKFSQNGDFIDGYIEGYSVCNEEFNSEGIPPGKLSLKKKATDKLKIETTDGYFHGFMDCAHENGIDKESATYALNIMS